MEILHVTELGPEPSTGSRALHHDRSVPLPSRVRSGSMEEESLVLEGAEIPWEDITLIGLGIVEWVVKDAEGPQTMVQKMIGKALMGREEEKGSGKGKQTSDVYFLDLFAQGHDQAFRFDSATVNYRQFLDDVGYISLHNFYKLVIQLCRRAVNARFDPSMAAFVERRRHEVRRYGAIYDFELEIQNFMNRLDTMIPQSELDLSRDNWMDEWDDW
ncbi:MAG: hypothetical protein HY319_06930 [Armatimonadetes bacterium]|nr:hypothetical protein [Armatimonadota bacterium]